MVKNINMTFINKIQRKQSKKEKRQVREREDRIKEIAGVATTGLARTGSGTNFDKRVPKSDRCEFLQEERYLSLRL